MTETGPGSRKANPHRPARGGNMKRVFGAAVLAATFVGGGCRQAVDDTPAWFNGTFEEAMASAQSRGTMLMLDFYSPN